MAKATFAVFASSYGGIRVGGLNWGSYNVRANGREGCVGCSTGKFPSLASANANIPLL